MHEKVRDRHSIKPTLENSYPPTKYSANYADDTLQNDILPLDSEHARDCLEHLTL